MQLMYCNKILTLRSLIHYNIEIDVVKLCYDVILMYSHKFAKLESLENLTRFAQPSRVRVLFNL